MNIQYYLCDITKIHNLILIVNKNQTNLNWGAFYKIHGLYLWIQNVIKANKIFRNIFKEKGTKIFNVPRDSKLNPFAIKNISGMVGKT